MRIDDDDDKKTRILRALVSLFLFNLKKIPYKNSFFRGKINKKILISMT